MFRCVVNGNVVAAFARSGDAARFFSEFTAAGGEDCMVLLDPGVPTEGFVVDTCWTASNPGTTKVFFSASEAEATQFAFEHGRKNMLKGECCVFARVRLLRLADMSAVRRDNEGDFVVGSLDDERVTYGNW
jgi:hypothetical protein